MLRNTKLSKYILANLALICPHEECLFDASGELTARQLQLRALLVEGKDFRPQKARWSNCVPQPLERKITISFPE